MLNSACSWAENVSLLIFKTMVCNSVFDWSFLRCLSSQSCSSHNVSGTGFVSFVTQQVKIRLIDRRNQCVRVTVSCGPKGGILGYTFPDEENKLYFEKNIVGLWDNHAVCVTAYRPHPNQLLNAWTNPCETMAPELISAACFINPSHQSVCLYMYLPIVAR
jgi:hypothetical protein